MSTVPNPFNEQPANTPPAPVAPVDNSGGPAVIQRVRPAKGPAKSEPLPPFKVLLHNDDVNSHEHVVGTLRQIIHLDAPTANRCMLEAEYRGLSLLTVTHKERAEFLQEQLVSKGLSSTIEPD